MSVTTSVVIPVHGNVHLTRRCLDMVLAELPEEAEVVVVDDASTDSTPGAIDEYGEAIRRLRLEKNAGFAAACNAGAELARGDRLVFLNNDVEPIAGWLQELEAYAEAHPEAATVGAKLLYPNGTVQHGGVVFGQDGYPHHLYAGFPADHPAVNCSRPLQAVTGACMLVRRLVFEAAGGFDTGFFNSLEDIDLCLRLGDENHEVHYCHQAVLVHLESASRGRSDRFERSLALYRERWRERVRRDDIEVYLADGLLAVEYHEAYPARFSVDPQLAVVDRGREEEIERLLEGYARQTSGLLQEVVRLTALGEGAWDGSEAGEMGSEKSAGHGDRQEFLARVSKLEDEIRGLQMGKDGDAPLIAGSSLGYRYQVESVLSAIHRVAPAGSLVLVVSRGDRELIRLDRRTGWHFPRAESGAYRGDHPANSEEAIEHLEHLRRVGADFLVFPPTSYWWLDHYEGLREHLDEHYPRLEAEACEIFALVGNGNATEGHILAP